MPSFDAVNQVDLQEVDNALTNTRKELETRYDFRGSKTEIEFDKKGKVIKVLTADSMKMDAIKDILIGKMIKRGVDPKCLKFGVVDGAALGQVRQEIKIAEGIEKEIAKKIVKIVKDSKIKVQASIMDEMVRVSGKQIDDLQEVIALLKGSNVEVPLQFVNFKS